MTDQAVHSLLDLACANVPTATAGQAAHDLRRAHAARSRHRTRYAALGATGATVLALGGLGVGLFEHPAQQTYLGVHHSQPRIRLVAQQLDADPYTFAATPQGWAVQGTTPYAVTIAPTDGSVSDNPADFVGKLVITFSHDQQTGQALSYDGRDFVERGDSGYTTVATHTRAQEPDGWVVVQYPDNVGWTTRTMLEFLASVQVGASAQTDHG